MALDFGSNAANSPWLAALRWMKSVFARQQRLAQRPLDEVPENTIPKRLRAYLLDFDQDGNPVSLRGDRYEFWVYRQLRKRLEVGDMYVDDSVQHRLFADELVAPERKAEVAQGTGYSLATPAGRCYSRRFVRRTRYAVAILWPGTTPGEAQASGIRPGQENPDVAPAQSRSGRSAAKGLLFQVMACDIADIFRFVNEQCRFL